LNIATGLHVSDVYTGDLLSKLIARRAENEF
jgi:hypothetical protein